MRAKIYGALALLSWLVLLVSLSRTIFIAGVAGLIVLFVLIVLHADWKARLKKLAVLLVLFAAAFALTQVSVSAGKDETSFGRFEGNQFSQTSYNSRFLFWAIGLEAFKENPLIGVGADNYAAVYRSARKSFATHNEAESLTEINETILPERAHNEYLQILAELGICGTLLFVWFLFGALKFTLSAMVRRRVSSFPSRSLPALGALAGMSAFFVSSIASSYSFRVTVNGACFFFLLALAIEGLSKGKRKTAPPEKFKFDFYGYKPSFFATGLTICMATMIFSAVRGASLMYLQNGLNAENEQSAEENFRAAQALDDRDPLIKYYDAMRLYNSGRAAEAIPQMRFAVDKGISTSIAYFYLAAAQIAVHRNADADQTLREALRVYPRSVFLRSFYAEYLRENERGGEAEIQDAKAVETNREQAKSWRLAFGEGMAALNRKDKGMLSPNAAKNNAADFVRVMDLQPTQAIYVVLDFQRQNNPNLLRRPTE